MLRTILVGIEPSEFSTAALDLGVRWAQQFDAMLVGIGVVDRPGICRADRVPVERDLQNRRDAAMIAEATAQVDSCLGHFSLRCAQAGVACKVLEDVGDPFEQIATEAQRYDLIILGQETHFRFETQPSADDTLNKLLKSSPRPIVVAPAAANGGDKEGVLVCCDGGAKASRALKSYVEMGFPKERPVTVLSIDQSHLYAAKKLDRAADYLLQHGIQTRPLPIESVSFPGDTILEQAEALGAGLVVMGVRSRSVLAEFLVGSVTKAVIRGTKVPVLLDH